MNKQKIIEALKRSEKAESVELPIKQWKEILASLQVLEIFKQHFTNCKNINEWWFKVDSFALNEEDRKIMEEWIENEKIM